MSELNRIIGDRLLKSRKEKGWKLAEIAEKIDATLQQYSNWERGMRPVSIEYLHKLADIYEKNGAWLSAFSDDEHDTKMPTIIINDNLMGDDLKKGDEVQIDTSIRQPTTTDIFAIEVNGQIWARWMRPELDGSYTIKATDENLWPEIKITDLESLRKITIIGRVHCIKRHI